MVTCSGMCDASVQALVTGGDGNYTFVWSTGATTQSITNLCPDIYDLTVFMTRITY